jgi:class 3 adenylate cyclase/putative methionine-R-sulfoxide reductase with GAF domain
MKRRSRAGGELTKGRHRKAPKPKGRNARKAAAPSISPPTGEEAEVARLTRELNEALERQAATSEVLQVISGSPGNLEPVFAAMLENAVRICDAKWGNIHRWDSDALHLLATHNTPPAFAKARGRSPNYPGSDTAFFGRMVATKTVAHVADAAAEQPYIERSNPAFVAAVELGGARTALAVPMLKDNELIGTLALARQEVRPFTDKQIALVTNFAAQAVIAIENARLLNELRQSLEQQTATAQVLQVISSSTGDLAHVFATMLENATRVCDAKFGTLYLKERDGFRAAATHNAPASYEEARAKVVHPSPHTTHWQAANTKRPVQIADVTLERGYLECEPFVVSAFTLGGYRSVLSVPMLHEDQVMGVINIFRQEVSFFSAEHISLLQNFAAQAVIAIENARLLNDLRDRTQQLQAQSEELADLNQQLEQRVADQVGEIERMGRLRRFLPPQVADLIVASGTEKQLESHRREITALFCDLRGFTGFTESADAEDVMALLRDYHASIGEKIIKYNGTLERYAGDGVMVVFNDPVPVENPALQAVLMALEVRDAIGALTATWSRLGHEIGFGIGIAHGFATLGTIGFEGRFDYAAIGTVSNVASRLCDEAKPGQILISPRVLTKVENSVTVEPVGEFELKGIRRPLAAYNVLGAVSAGA